MAAAGRMIALLDACLVNGFNLKSVTSLRVADGVATVTTDGDAIAGRRRPVQVLQQHGLRPEVVPDRRRPLPVPDLQRRGKLRRVAGVRRLGDLRLWRSDLLRSGRPGPLVRDRQQHDFLVALRQPERELRSWWLLHPLVYRLLFQPAVLAGIGKPGAFPDRGQRNLPGLGQFAERVWACPIPQSGGPVDALPHADLDAGRELEGGSRRVARPVSAAALVHAGEDRRRRGGQWPEDPAHPRLRRRFRGRQCQWGRRRHRGFYGRAATRPARWRTRLSVAADPGNQ